MRSAFILGVLLLGSTARADEAGVLVEDQPTAGAYEWIPPISGLADDAFTNVFGPTGRIVRDSLVIRPVSIVLDSSRPVRFDRDLIRCCICAMMGNRDIEIVEPTKFLGADEDLLQLRVARGAFGH